MQLSLLKDQALHEQLKKLVACERDFLAKILRHLLEIDRRKLFCDFGCSSLFEYASKELGYSEGQAYRRIQAMRLMREVPQVEKKIKTGELSLSNISKAQCFFKELNRSKKNPSVSKQTKIQILKKLENKSARDGERILCGINPKATMPKEKERILSEEQTELRFVVDTATKKKLEQVRSLLGQKGTSMIFSELVDHMAELSIGSLEAKRFGKKRTASKITKNNTSALSSKPNQTLASNNSVQVASLKNVSNHAKTTTSRVVKPSKSRYIHAAIKHAVWRRDKGKCQGCKTSRGLQYDHIIPFALGGKSSEVNLRLLCFHCNQRSAMKVFSLDHMYVKRKESLRK